MSPVGTWRNWLTGDWVRVIGTKRAEGLVFLCPLSDSGPTYTEKLTTFTVLYYKEDRREEDEPKQALD